MAARASSAAAGPAAPPRPARRSPSPEIRRTAPAARFRALDRWTGMLSLDAKRHVSYTPGLVVAGEVSWFEQGDYKTKGGGWKSSPPPLPKTPPTAPALGVF